MMSNKQCWCVSWSTAGFRPKPCLKQMPVLPSFNGSPDYKRRCLHFKSVVSRPSDTASVAKIAPTATSLRESYIFNCSKCYKKKKTFQTLRLFLTYDNFLMLFSMCNFEFIIFIIILSRRQTARETDLLVLGYMFAVYIFIWLCLWFYWFFWTRHWP